MAKKNTPVEIEMEPVTETETEVVDQSEEFKEPEGLKVSLSKANKIRNLVKARMDSLNAEISQSTWKTILVDESDTMETFNGRRTVAVNKVLEVVQQFAQLNQIYTILKVTIAKANTNTDVSAVMAHIEQTKFNLSMLNALATCNSCNTEEIERFFAKNAKIALNEQVQKANKIVSTMPVVYAKANFALFHEDEVKREVEGVSDLRKQLRNLEERRNELNYSTTIIIEPSIVSVLETHKII